MAYEREDVDKNHGSLRRLGKGMCLRQRWEDKG